VFAGGDALVPAELVFFPYRPPPGGSLNFGPSTNGLCSGNSIRECLLHGLLEVIERDVRSFHWTTGRTRLVLPSSMPPEVDRVLASIASAELSIWIRYLENAFGLPCFMAVISDLDDPDPFYLSAGYGCHLSRAVAITRAVCEAAQSRLSFIHGGRDDLVERHHRFESLSDEQRRAYVRTQQEAAADATGAIRFEDTPDPGAHVPDIESALQHLRSILEGQGIQSACQVVFTRPEDTIQVSKVIVPGLEHFTASSPRVGKRLRAHVGANL
jgi:ribosomal protein S12 methylthiotransferase accessory factor